MKKKLLSTVVAVVLVVVIVIAAGLFFIDSLAKGGIEKAGTHAMGVETTLGGADIGLFSGSFGLDAFNVANPAGFPAPHFLDLGKAEMELKVGSLLSDTVVVPRIELKGIDLILEKKDGQYNYQAILDNLAKLSSGEKSAEPAAEGGKKVMVEQVLVTDVKVTAPAIGDKSITINIPMIKLTNVGSDSDKGVLVSELISQITGAIFQAILANAGDLLPAAMFAGLESSLGQFTNLGGMGVETIGEVGKVADAAVQEATKAIDEGAKAAEQAVSEATKSVDEAAQGAQEAVDEIGKGLGNLFGGDKEE